ncbi:Transcriptional regulator [gamma proteobacterium HdN1]|nr:Transcriptional regulator [gamma proteobacterium HdN1]
MEQMTKTTNSTPKISERAQAQRERILSAAQICFVDRGFHAASMAAIAETAGMSQGLIYRYFAGKDEIILAIIARELTDSRNDIASLQTGNQLAARIEELFSNWLAAREDTMNARLFLELTSEASRAPKILEAVKNSDLQAREDLGELFRRASQEHGRQLSEGELCWRAFSLQVFVEGLVVRALREPEVDPQLLTQSLQAFLPIWLGRSG